MNNRISNNRPLNVSIQQGSNNNNPVKSFNEVLETIKQHQEVKFSKHALERLESRNIKLNFNDMNRINNALDKASHKGIKETLIFMDNKALVASVPNKTIITVTIGEQLKDSVFTNIDGAVII